MKRKKNYGRPNTKSIKTGVDELEDMIKSAVKEALEDDDTKDDDVIDDGQILDIVQDVVEDVVEKRKSRKDDGEDITEETLVEEIVEAVEAAVDAEAKSDDDPILDEAVLDLVEDVVSDVVEKRKARKEDGEDLKDDDIVGEIIDAVETAIDEEAKEDGAVDDEKRKRKRKTASRRRQTKSYSAGRRPSSPAGRKYSDIYMPRSGGAAQSQKKVPPEIQLARAVKCLDVFGRHDPEQAAFMARKHYSDDNMAREFKALSATVPSSGGYLIPEVYLDEIIEMLYAKTVIFELGARKVPMTNGNLNIPKMTSGARATWGGEARKIAKTQPAFGNVKLSAKRLEAIVPQTRELIMSTNYSADAIFASDLTRRMELGLDWGGLFGKGGEFQPLGVQNTPGIMVLDAAALGSSNPDLADASGKITADFPVYVRSAVLAKNVDDLGLGWTFNSMMEGYLMNLKTTTGAYIYREEMNSGNLLGFQYKVSNQIPTDSNNKTSMFFGNWADLLIGEQLGLETYTTLDGSWTDEEGVTHNAFEENLSATRALMYVDIATRHAESFAYIKNCVIA